MRTRLPRLATLALLVLTACRAAPSRAPAPVPEAACAAFARARALRAAGAGPEDPELREALLAASAAAPEWVAPARMLDDLALTALLGPVALEARRAELARAPRDARACYLVGRLEQGDARRFEAAVALDPELAWAHHGLSWALGLQREEARALEHAERALALARADWERAFFRLALARRLRAFGHEERALAVLRQALENDPPPERDLGWFAALVARFELASAELEEARVGYARGLELLRGELLRDADLEQLVGELERREVGLDLEKSELELALARRDSPLRRELRARLRLRRGGDALSEALYLAGREPREAWRDAGLGRATLVERGHPREAVELWLEALPAVVLDSRGLPRRAELGEVVRAARQLADPPGAAGLARLGEAFLAAGWFREARGLAPLLAPLDLEAALALHDRGAAGETLIAGLASSLLDVERGRADLAAQVALGAPEPRDGPRPKGSTPGDLDELLGRWAGLFARAAPWLGGGSREEFLAELEETPRSRYGPFATVLHPGPVFTPYDSARGLGQSGTLVPGLAPLLERLGRFAIVGTVLGQRGPDGTLLRLLALEELEGRHLGAPWSGAVAWCEGTDLASRAGRHGAQIAGAALHEGYWVDVRAVRRELSRWSALREAFEGQPERLEAALATGGLSLGAPPGLVDARRRERKALGPLLDQADRVRLAVLSERGSAEALLGQVTLDELVSCVARHEEGHLCDRGRFLPLEEHVPELLGLLLAAGLDPTRLQEELELRAQLTALCVVEDPRLPLIEILDAAETGSAGGLPHAAAYRRLLADLLRLLERRLEVEPEHYPALDEGRTLVHQLHRLGPEELRELALVLALRRGLVADQAAASSGEGFSNQTWAPVPRGLSSGTWKMGVSQAPRINAPSGAS